MARKIYCGIVEQVERIDDTLSLVTFQKKLNDWLDSKMEMTRWIKVVVPFYKGLDAQKYENRIVELTNQMVGIARDSLKQTIEGPVGSDSVELPFSRVEQIATAHANYGDPYDPYGAKLENNHLR